MATPLWQEGDWAYEWQGNGMLRSVKRPDGETVSFEYDPLGRRISKTYKDKTTRWVWDGNVPLHEWTEEENVTTWLFEEGSFVPCAKLQNGESYSIITDYLGTPTEMYTSNGEKTWSAELDIYGSVRNFAGRSLSDCPFRYQGQYEDEETGLYYNRFRYYSPDSGIYISQDPIRLAGNNPTLYAYVHDTNVWIDSWGLKGTGIPFQVGLHEDLIKINAGTGLDSHHVGQKALMDKLVANYDEMKAPAILVPSVGHTRTKDGVGIVSRSPINPKTGKPFTNARELLARDIRELRRVYGDTISNKQLQELINLNKSMYPEMNKPKTGHH